MKTTVTELPDSRVEVEVEVPADDVERGLQRAARSAGARDAHARLPQGQGAAVAGDPAGRLRRRAARRRSATRCPSGTSGRCSTPGSARSATPSIEIVSTPEAEGEPLEFKFEVGVRPKAKLGEYKGLEVGRAEAEVPEEIVDREVERIREGFARLEPVERAGRRGRRRC